MIREAISEKDSSDPFWRVGKSVTMEILENTLSGIERLMHLTVVSDYHSWCDMECSLEELYFSCCLIAFLWSERSLRKTSEYGFEEGAFSHPIFTDDSDSLTSGEYRLTDIEERFFSSDKSILNSQYCLIHAIFRRIKSEFDSLFTYRLFDAFYFFESSFSTLGESCTRASTETIDKSFLCINIGFLFFIFLHCTGMLEFLRFHRV